MRTLAAVVVSVLLLSWGALPLGAASSSPVALSVSVGYDGYFRDNAAWVPVRISARNSGLATIHGTVETWGEPDAFADRYSANLLLPPGTRKQITLYLPGAGIQGSVRVTYRSGASVLASEETYPNPFGDLDLVVGALTDDPASTLWLRRVEPRHTSIRPVPLTTSMLDTNPLALATFDAIVISNVDTSALDQAQVASLDRYVRNGGSLILVGGSDWQETLRPLPSGFVPGLLAGSRTVPDLQGLSSLGPVPPPRPSTASVLSRPRGVVLASQHGVPLVTRSQLGDGQIEYLAFDPADAPIAGWHGAGGLLTHLVAGAAPLSMRRVGLQPEDRISTFLNPGRQPFHLTSELQNLSAPGLGIVLSLLIIAVSLAALVILLGWIAPRRSRRPRLTWAALPALVAVSILMLGNVTPSLARREAIINTINVVTLDQPGPTHPADRYVSLFAPLGGEYDVGYSRPALAQQLIAPEPAPPDVPAAEFDQGARTTITLPGTSGWSARQFVLHTSVAISGRINARLHLDRVGDVIGTVANNTSIDLRRVAVVVGLTYLRLGDIRAGQRKRVSIDLDGENPYHDYPQVLFEFYGQSLPDPTATGAPARPPEALLGSPPGLPAERTLDQRIENAVSALPETRLLSVFGDATLVAWTDHPLGSFTVNGTSPQERDLTMLVQPLSIGFPRGRFRLPGSVIGAWPVELVPGAPQIDCCGPTVQPISLVPGTWASFAFVLPAAHVHAAHLSLSIYAGGADPLDNGYSGIPDGSLSVFDWRANRWRGLHVQRGHARLPDPNRLVSSTGAVLVRLTSTNRSGDLTILDPHQDLLLTGEARTT